MANQVMPKALEGFASAAINLPSGDIRVLLVDTGQYTFSSTHQFLSSVASGARVATSGALTGKTVTNGVFRADPPTITIAGGQPTAEALYVYLHTGTDGTARLIAWIDTATGGLPAQPGGDVQILWNAAGIFTL